MIKFLFNLKFDRMGNGDCYEGDCKSNHFEGEGSYLSHEKELYTGTWHNHRRHGHGEQTYLDESRYSGDWIANKRHGFGKLTDGQDGSLIYEVFSFFVPFQDISNIYFSNRFVG
jgi:hypothetical protein